MLKLLNVKLSKHCMYPGDTIYITCTYEALCDYPIKEKSYMYCDLIFGYQTLGYNCPSSYRIKGDFYPQPMHLKKGENISCSMRWNIPTNAYPGSYKINLGICDEYDIPIEISVNQKSHKRYYVGDFELAFQNVAPKFVCSHKNPVEWNFDLPQNCSYEKAIDIEIYVRDLEKDLDISFKGFLENGVVKTPYVDFSLNEISNGGATQLVLDNVCEKENYELLSVKLPTLLNGENAEFICSDGGGRLVNSTQSIEYGFEKKFQIKNVGILIKDGTYTMLDVPYLDDTIHYSVYSKNGQKYGAIGATLTYRLRKHGADASIKVINKPAVSILKTENFQEILDFLRKGLSRPNDFYDRCIFYYFQLYCDGASEIHTFMDALERVKKIYYMTGGVKQVMLLRGFQHNGHDTGYPDVFTLNKLAGTMNDLKYVVEEAKKYNAVITFHDNYDDLYPELEAYDASIAALDEYNNPYKGWIWVSGISNIISAPKYVKSGKMAERVKKTLQMYPVHSSYHLDVLSCEARRYDYDENVRVAAQEFVEYKKKIVEEFKSYGFNVTSEGASQPFAGIIGHSWSGISTNEQLFTSDKFFPILGMYFHGILPSSCHKKTKTGSPNTAGILCGGEIVPQIAGDPTPYYKKEFYLFTLPMGLLCDLFINDFSEENGVNKITYSDGTILYYDEINDYIEIKKADGTYYTKDSNTFVKGFKENEYLGYTKSGNFVFDLPCEMEIEKAFIIDFDGEKNVIDLKIENGKLFASLSEDTAFKVIVKTGE